VELVFPHLIASTNKRFRSTVVDRSGNNSSAADLARLANAVLRNPLLSRIVAEPSVTLA
jgi:D-alanyl-D-alanine carboxypeptidase